MSLTQDNADDPHLMDPLITKPNPFWKRYIHEPLVFTFFFSYCVTMNCSSSLFFDRACVVYLNHSVDECKNETDLLNKAQIIANNYGLCGTLIRFIPEAILGIFIGPWSDKYGKKTPIYIATFGSILSAAGMVWYICVDNLPLVYACLTSVPTGIAGGSISYLACIYAMATDSTSVQSRTFKYGLLELALSVAVPLAALTGGMLYDSYGYKFVFILAFGTTFVPLILLFFVEDEGHRIEATWKTKMTDFFTCENLMDNVRTVLKPRRSSFRLQILLLCLSSIIIVFNYIGMAQLMYFYCQKLYGWTLLYYSEVTAVGSLACTVFVLGFIPLLTRIIKMSDAYIGLIGVLSLLFQQVFRAFSTKPWMYFTSIAFGLPSATAPMAVRSIVSKIVDNNELTKIFAVLAETEAFVPILASLMGSQVYNASIYFFPGLLLVIMAVLLLIPLVVFLWIGRQPRVSETVDD